MKFKDYSIYNNFFVVSLNAIENPIPMPDPEVGKIYHGFDDGKIKLSRLVDWKIIKQIDLDKDKVSNYLLRIIQREIKECYWLYESEQTIIYRAYAVDENGKYDKDIGYCYFIRTKQEGWFGVNNYMSCELDVDNRWYTNLIKQENE